MTKPLSSPCRGYIEGYYGRLLNWTERNHLTAVLAETGMNTYLYAPKEDPAHRFNWRQDWDADWWQHFGEFTTTPLQKMLPLSPVSPPDLISILAASARKMVMRQS